MGVTAAKLKDGDVVLYVPECDHVLTKDEAEELAVELQIAAREKAPTALELLRDAINQRQFELIKTQMRPETDLLLNSMQQAYYVVPGPHGPNTQVYELNATGEQMLKDGPQKFKPPEAE